MKKLSRIVIFLSVFVLIIAGIVYGYKKITTKVEEHKNGIGEVLDTYEGVDVYYNGEDYTENHGKNYSKDGYYYGYKWQCVEFIKRYFYEAKAHKMPDVYGNAKDFYDENVEHGKLNEKRGLVQFKNGEGEKPEPDDLLVFKDTTYGHVVIVTEVGDDYIEVIQQNMGNVSRDRFDLEYKDGKYHVGGKRVPAGWLRKL